MDEQFEREQFLPLRKWLRENLHRHGRKFTPKETLQRITGKAEMDVAPYLRYLNAKFSGIYGLKQESNRDPNDSSDKL
ncbi:MAG: hypothetical protein ACK4SN_00800 [Bellilinea sp.]